MGHAPNQTLGGLQLSVRPTTQFYKGCFEKTPCSLHHSLEIAYQVLHEWQH